MDIYAKITKRDDETRMVYGYASTEALDVQGEVVTKAAIEAALPEYLKFSNIREMHSSSAVGVAKSADIDDKGLYISAKVVDDTAWEKVKEGVYKGFSIGGKAISKVSGVIEKMRLTEISLVDRPANPECVIDLYKADIDNDINKYLGEEAWDAQRAIEALNMVYNLFNKESNETETNADQLASLKTVIDNLKAFIASEISEPTEAVADDSSIVEMSEMPESLVKIAHMLNKGDITSDYLIDLIESDTIEKAGARNSKSDKEKLQAMHDHAVSLGADCSTTKADTFDDIAKADIAKLHDELTIAKAEAAEWKAKFEAKPNYGNAFLKSVAITKDADIGKDEAAEDIAKAIDGMSESEKATALIKLIHQHGR